jgi:hypothetical protein
MGIRRLTYHLHTDCHIWVSRAAVNNSLKVVDAEGLELRRQRKLRRRVFTSNGPNEVWSLDGYDKLSRWGLAIHGCNDVYSRFLLWLRVGISNNDPLYILSYYLEAVEEAAKEGANESCMLILYFSSANSNLQ